MSEFNLPTQTHAGGCLCGAVRYVLKGALRAIIACHCRQCRKMTGHHFAATATRRANLTLTEQRGLRWYQSSPAARRGFCAECGSTLFWDAHAYPQISITAGSLDGPTGLRLVQHIFVADQGDYYAITDGVPQSAGRSHNIRLP